MGRRRGWIQRKKKKEKDERRQELIKQQKCTYHSLSSDVGNPQVGPFSSIPVQRPHICVKEKEPGGSSTRASRIPAHCVDLASTYPSYQEWARAPQRLSPQACSSRGHSHP